ncbi:MAG: precorrin-6A/cobalt-precorrin-6A reductase, partial [Rhodospirillaceae bacterium]
VHFAVVTGRPPHALDDERDLLAAHDIDTLVSKASGGPLPAKIAAAAERGIPMILIRPPAPPPGVRVETEDAVLAWLDAGPA